MKILERKDNLQMFWLKHTLDRNDSKGLAFLWQKIIAKLNLGIKIVSKIISEGMIA